MKRHIALILFFLVVSVGFMFSPVIGPSWDEPDNMFSAGVYVNFFRNGFDPAYFEMATNESLAYKASAYGDRIVPQYRTMAELPPLHNYVGALLVSGAKMLGIGTSPAVIIAAFHWATVLFLGILVAFVYRFGILLGLSTAGSIFAALTVFLYPQVFGHGLSNIKDTAQAALFVTSLYYLVKKKFPCRRYHMGLRTGDKI